MKTVIGPVPTLWDGNGPLSALHLSADILSECQPDFAQIHTGEPGPVASAVRKILPKVELIVGVGVDGTARDVVSERHTVEWAIAHLVTFAQRAVVAGAFAICWNAEGNWKTPPNSEQRKRLSEVVRGTLAAVAEKYPTLLQYHTSYDHPTYHTTYNWSDWIGPQSPVVVSMPQVYAAPEGDVMASRGALPAREARALASWAVAVKNGWIDKDVPDGQPGDETDVDFRPYFQLHHVPAVDTITCALQSPFAGLWALSSRSDTAGRNALRACCALKRSGLWLPGLETYGGRKVSTAVRLHQRALGVADDGNYGAKTAKADGIVWE